MADATTKSKSDAGSTDATSTAQGRFTVAIPADVRPMLDALQDELGKVTVRGVEMVVPLTYAQVISTLIKSTSASTPNGTAASDEN